MHWKQAISFLVAHSVVVQHHRSVSKHISNAWHGRIQAFTGEPLAWGTAGFLFRPS